MAEAEAQKAVAGASMQKAEFEMESNKAIMETRRMELEMLKLKLKRPADEPEIPDAKRQRSVPFQQSRQFYYYF